MGDGRPHTRVPNVTANERCDFMRNTVTTCFICQIGEQRVSATRAGFHLNGYEAPCRQQIC